MEKPSQVDAYEDMIFNPTWMAFSLSEHEKSSLYAGENLWCLFEIQPTINCHLSPRGEVSREVIAVLLFTESRRTSKKMWRLMYARCT